MAEGEKRSLEEWKTWRGEVKVNKHLHRKLGPGRGLLWEGSVWVCSEQDRKQLEQLIADDRLAGQGG